MHSPFKKTPSKTLTNALAEIEAFKLHAKTQKCPACNKTGLFKISLVEYGKKGWEINFGCDCGLIAILNKSGYHFEGGQLPR